MFRLFHPLATAKSAPHGGPKPVRGFTLVELLVTMVIAVVLAAVAVPDLSDFVTKNVVRTEADALVTTLSSARNEAIRTNTLITVCAGSFKPSTTSTAAVNTPTCRTSSRNDWSAGWVSFVDTNHNHTSVNDDDTRNVHMPANRPISIVSAGFVRSPTSTATSHAITFAPSGRSLSGSGTITLSASTDTRTFSVVVSVSAGGMVALGDLSNTPRP